MHATDFARSVKKNVAAATGLAVLYGDEPALKRQIIRTLHERLAGSDDMALMAMPGKEADWPRINDELSTVSMFGDHRLVVIDAADDFVSKNRHHLENYADAPATAATLVLDVTKWPKNTRLAKKVAADGPGLAVECGSLKGAKLTKYLAAAASDRDKKLAGDASALLVTLVGTSLSLLEQEIDKLATYVGERDTVTDADVRTLVGGWSTETTFAMLNAVRDGQLGTALEHLDALLTSGEAPQRIMGGIGYVYKKLALAIERSRMGTPLGVALKESGFRPFETPALEQYLRRVGRPSAEQFRLAIQTVDLGLKGNSRLPERIQMERLLVALAGGR